MTLYELAQGVATIPEDVQRRMVVAIILNDHQAVVAEEAWIDAEDGDQFIIGPPGSHAVAMQSVRARRPSN